MSELNWHWPWVWLLMLLPILLRLLLPAHRHNALPLQVASLDAWQPALATHAFKQSLSWRFYLALGIWALLLTALARPYQLGEIVEMPTSGRDLLLAVDLSQSMEVQDMQLNGQPVDRLVASKKVISDFIARRTGDRLGLVLFGSEAYLQAPLTFDRQTVTTLLLEAQIGLAGPKTAIGDAIGLSIKRLAKENEQSRVLILMTDGANTSGALDPLKAADLAAANQVRIYTLGLGAERMQVNSFFGSRTINPSADMDEDSLREIARRTGGQYFRARNLDELNQIYALLDKLEPAAQDPEIFRPEQNLYQWPLLGAFILSLLLALSQIPWRLGGNNGR